MNTNYLLKNELAGMLYEQVKSLPIYDYHSHLSLEELIENRPFDNAGKMFIEHDHYIHRIMRAAGIDEQYITGGGGWRDKFISMISALEYAGASPVYQWVKLQLWFYFGIDDEILSENAAVIWDKASSRLSRDATTPLDILRKSDVRYITTTDDPSSSLKNHKIFNARSTGITAAPTFRTDKLLSICDAGYCEYLNKLSSRAQIEVINFSSFIAAVCERLDDFYAHGCRISDAGLQAFPSRPASRNNAESAFNKIISGGTLTSEEYDRFLGYMYVFLSSEYKKRGITMQLHIGARRNVNTELYKAAGADAGGDCIGDVDGGAVALLLDALNTSSALPNTILYTLNPRLLHELITICGSFRGVTVGAAWWFNDNITGIRETLNAICEYGYIGAFWGMLTDSRAFTGFIRHDYFRRILCSTVAEWVENGYSLEAAGRLCRAICCDNTKKLIGVTE